MAEVLVSKILDQLADVFFKQLAEEFKLVTGVKNELQNLSSKLDIIKRLLQDVERRKMKEKAVGIWLEKLEDVAYEMDDVLDEWNTQIQKLKLKAADEDSISTSSVQKGKVSKNLDSFILKWKKVRYFMLSICSCFKEVSVRHDIAQKIKELSESLNMIFKEGSEFNFVASDWRSNSREFKHVITTSMFDESEVCDRASDKNNIVRYLLSDHSKTSHGKDGTSVVSIVGTGGIGKTTLARLAYYDSRVKDHFDLIHWVCVSDPFDEKRIAKAILEGLEESFNQGAELQTLLHLIEGSISGKKFLLVLDDVWTEDDTKWNPFWYSLKDGAPGSRILVTTRNERVSRMMRSSYMARLGQLNELDCWKILSRIAFSGRSVEECQKLEKLGREIAKKCKGLPLAAKFLGSLLRFKDGVEQWEEVLDNNMWELKEAGVDLFAHMYLSYNELSPEMKHCFSYCAVFPKDSKLEVEKLILVWMAQGYLGSSRRTKDLELKGREYFDVLAMRSFFQEFERDYLDSTKVMSCKMHDIVHDFAQFLTRNECVIIEELGEEGTSLTREKARHLTWLLHEGDIAISSLIHDVGKLRSFYTKSIPSEMFSSMPSLRTLSLTSCSLEELSREVGKLIHLRYLDLSHNPLRELPEEIGDLYNLESLNIRGCKELIHLPQTIGNIINLRHLLNWGTFGFKQFSQALEKLTSLQTLDEFKAGSEYSKMAHFKTLNQLKGELRIKLFDPDEADIENAQLNKKRHIIRLHLNFGDRSVKASAAIEALQTPPNLQFLSIYQYRDTKMPSWIVTSLNNLRELWLGYSENLVFLPALGKLPALEKLTLLELKSVKYMGREFLGITEKILHDGTNNGVAFPKLKNLEILFLQNLEIWEDPSEEEENFVSIMPCLEGLEVSHCYKLEGLPHRIIRKAKSLSILRLLECHSMKERYEKGTGYDWINISHIPNVRVRWQ